MFFFKRSSRIIDDSYSQKFSEKYTQWEAKKAEREKARQEMYECMAQEFSEQHNIAVYFNQRRRDLPGYEILVCQKQPNCYVELERPLTIDQTLIRKIQGSSGFFLMGCIRDDYREEVDIYDAGNPHEIRREKRYSDGTSDCGSLKISELEAYEIARQESKPRIGPKVRVVEVDDIMNIPIKGANSSGDYLSH